MEPAVAVTEYTDPVAFGQSGVGPVIADVAGRLFSATLKLTGAPVPQLLVSVTVTVPAVVPKVTVIESVLVGEDVIVAPAGTVHE